MSIRNGDYLDQDSQPTKEFYEIVDSLEKRLSYDKENTSLKDRVNMNEIDDFVEYVNGKIIEEERS